MATPKTFKKKFSGELFDLTITDNMNIYGREKIKYALKNGISLPIQKYIDELQMMGTFTTDDKSEKRRLRLTFLNECNKIPFFQAVFAMMCNYLNGGDGFTQHIQFFIIVCAGGNIITIFAQLIKNLIESVNITTTSIDPDKLVIFNRNIIYENLLDKEIFKTIELTIQFKQLIYELAEKSYSDFDYNLLPNIKVTDDEQQGTSQQDESQQGESQQDESQQDESQQGGVSARQLVANAKKADKKIEADAKAKAENAAVISKTKQRAAKAREKRLAEETAKALVRAAAKAEKAEKIARQNVSKAALKEQYKQLEDTTSSGFVLFRIKSYLGYDTIQKERLSSNNCTNLIPDELFQFLFPQMAQENWKDTVWWKIMPEDELCKQFLLYLLSQKNEIANATRINIEATIRYIAEEILPSANDLDSIIAYLHNTTHNLNKFISNYNYDYWSNNDSSNYFTDLNTMIDEDNGVLIILCKDILREFLINPIYHTENILKQILLNTQVIDPKLEQQKVTRFVVPTSLRHSKIFTIFNDFINADIGIPNGCSITINAIIPDDSSSAITSPILPTTQAEAEIKAPSSPIKNRWNIVKEYINQNYRGLPAKNISIINGLSTTIDNNNKTSATIDEDLEVILTSSPTVDPMSDAKGGKKQRKTKIKRKTKKNKEKQRKTTIKRKTKKNKEKQRKTKKNR